MDTDPQSYILSEDESRAIFERVIVPAELGALPPVSSNAARTPLAVLLTGQTGAGKTRTAPALKSAITQLRGPAPLAHFVADTYKTYHPRYQALLAAQPSLASAAAGPDARRWLLMAASRAAGRRADVLLESAVRHPADFADLARLFRARGYRVEVAVLAVPAPLSRLGILARYHERLPEAGPARGLPVRLTPRRVHDESYEGLLRAAAFVDAGDAVDQVVVVRRDSAVAYADERVDGVWRRGAGVARAVRAERQRPLTPVERTGTQMCLRRLREMDVPGLESQLEEIEGLLKPLLVDPDDEVYAPLRPLSLPTSAHDERFDIEAGLRLGMAEF
ncbi:zeta toxin-domain-containing protein [Annulohypoxylon bovei var. microspora]|nr:zeta toxin-domain-containing protein [Annulohypoxylon bovei var. microspora]